MPRIKSITCHKILNAHAHWTIETHVKLDDGSVGIHAIPEGIAKSDRELVNIPADKAVDIVSTVINDALYGEDASYQEAIDRTLVSMDGTVSRHHLGANSIMSVSLAVAEAMAISKNVPLYEYLSFLYNGKNKVLSKLVYPTPIFTLVSCGPELNTKSYLHELLLIPSRALSYKRALEMGVHVYQELFNLLQARDFSVGTSSSGGFITSGLSTQQIFNLVRQATIDQYKAGENVFFGLDMDATALYHKGKYLVEDEIAGMDYLALHDYYTKLLKKYEIIYLEDPFAYNDISSWSKFYESNKNRVMLGSDVLSSTNLGNLHMCVSQQLCNSVLVKPNQIGTLTETFEFIKEAKNHGISVVLSHRSGDIAENTFIADLALAVEADFLKSGAPARGENVSKYNRLLEILADN